VCCETAAICCTIATPSTPSPSERSLRQVESNRWCRRRAPPNLNAYAERWVRSVKEECLCKVILFGERSLRRALSEYVEHFHAERNHQGKGNVLLFPRGANPGRDGHVQCRERLGGLLRYYHQEPA
jgi:hypothetical protein